MRKPRAIWGFSYTSLSADCGVFSRWKIHLVELVEAGQVVFVGFGRFVAAVVKAVFSPRRAGNFHPVQFFGQQLVGGQVQDAHLVPVGTAPAGGVGQVAVVVAEFDAGQGRGAIGRKPVGVEQHARFFGTALAVEHGLVLQAVVLAKHQVFAYPLRHAVALVIPHGGEPRPDLIPKRNLVQVTEGELVLGRDPGLGLGRVEGFEPAVGVGYGHAEIGVGNVGCGRWRVVHGWGGQEG
jgi:hypothetical protein